MLPTFEPSLMQHRFITIEGNIGAGKTTLAHLLAKRLNARLILEEFADNPFLPKFYENPKQYAFPLELFFMAERFKQLKDNLFKTDLFQSITVSDYVFTKCLLFARINLPEEEFKLFQKLFDIMQQQLVFPDVIIYLNSSITRLQRNIKKRNRSYEQKIPDSYLQSIQDTYTNYIKQHAIKTIFVEADNADFLSNEAHMQAIIDVLDKDFEEQYFIELP
jgi:deoxyguanosine kinase